MLRNQKKIDEESSYTVYQSKSSPDGRQIIDFTVFYPMTGRKYSAAAVSQFRLSYK